MQSYSYPCTFIVAKRACDIGRTWLRACAGSPVFFFQEWLQAEKERQADEKRRRQAKREQKKGRKKKIQEVAHKTIAAVNWRKHQPEDTGAATSSRDGIRTVRTNAGIVKHAFIVALVSADASGTSLPSDPGGRARLFEVLKDGPSLPENGSPGAPMASPSGGTGMRAEARKRMSLAVPAGPSEVPPPPPRDEPRRRTTLFAPVAEPRTSISSEARAEPERQGQGDVGLCQEPGGLEG
jgi:hypothetical protein